MFMVAVNGIKEMLHRLVAMEMTLTQAIQGFMDTHEHQQRRFLMVMTLTLVIKDLDLGQ